MSNSLFSKMAASRLAAIFKVRLGLNFVPMYSFTGRTFLDQIVTKRANSEIFNFDLCDLEK
jgi:hypothetical protein